MLGPARLPKKNQQQYTKVDVATKRSNENATNSQQSPAHVAPRSPHVSPRSQNSLPKQSSLDSSIGSSLEMMSVLSAFPPPVSPLALEETTSDIADPAPHTSSDDKFLKLNIGGAAYRIRMNTVLKRPTDSFLYRFVRLSHEGKLHTADGYVDETQEWFFERSSQLFDPIYRYYITGVCHKPKNVCLEEFVAELAFWNITDSFFAHCCWPQRAPSLPDGEIAAPVVDEFADIRCGPVRKRIWNLIEVPESSLAARIFTFMSIGAVLVSNCGLVMGSIPDLQVTINKTIGKRNDTKIITITEPHPTLEYVEYVCITWFTLEYLAKIVCTPHHRAVFMQTMNLIDLVAIVPFYIELTLQLSGLDTTQLQDLKGALLVVRILRVLRVIRIFKLGKYSTGLQTFAKTLKESMKQLGMMGMVLATGIMFFSTLVYFLEKDEPDTGFTSIPAAFWWCIVTMTTVGYGDVVPTTVGGKLVASGAIACGVLVLALPITIIVDNFMKVSEETNALPSTMTHPYMRAAGKEGASENGSNNGD